MLEVLNIYMALFLPDVSTEELDQLAEAEDQSDHIKETVSAAWQRYLSSAEGETDAAGFRAYLDNTPDEQECRSYILGLHGLLAEIRIMGITQTEMNLCTKAILEPITPTNMQPVQMQQIIETSSVG